MTTLLVALAAVVAIGAAVRSTWSPCGLSMLSTLTPMGEAGRGRRYGPTVAWFVTGSVAGGLTLGLVMAGLAAVVALLHLSATVAGSLGLTACLVAAASDGRLAGFSLPVHHRQVNERWLDGYRAWVYGAGFGWQIGAGLATYITTAAVYLAMVLAALSGNPKAALGIGALFGTGPGPSRPARPFPHHPVGPPRLPPTVRRPREPGGGGRDRARDPGRPGAGGRPMGSGRGGRGGAAGRRRRPGRRLPEPSTPPGAGRSGPIRPDPGGRRPPPRRGACVGSTICISDLKNLSKLLDRSNNRDHHGVVLNMRRRPQHAGVSVKGVTCVCS